VGATALSRLALVVAVVALPGVASAHQTSVKYVDLAVDGPRVTVTFRVAPGDVTEPMHLPPDARPSAADAAATPAVAPYVAHWLAIEACDATAPAARPDDDAKFVVVTWAVTCTTTDELRLDFTAFFAVDQRHIAIVRLAAPGTDPIDAILRASSPRLVLRAGQTPPSLLAWIREGIGHIYGGRDHISFVLAILLVVMLVRDGTGTWQTRAPLATLRATAVVITAFTVAHSISLIAASLGWISLPSQLVESLIALSIAYTALEDVVKPDVRWRFGLTFGFGLIHGLGFASVLAEILPPHDVIVPLLCFNVGVEIGQLTIVAVALPVLYLAARALGAPRYRRRLMPVLATVIFVLGVNWLIERAFHVVVIPWTAWFGM
jgi:hypothetical protein